MKMLSSFMEAKLETPDGICNSMPNIDARMMKSSVSFGAGASNEVKTEPAFEDPKHMLSIDKQHSDVVRKNTSHFDEVKEKVTDEQRSETSRSRSKEQVFSEFEKISLKRPESIATFKPLTENMVSSDGHSYDVPPKINSLKI